MTLFQPQKPNDTGSLRMCQGIIVKYKKFLDFSPGRREIVIRIEVNEFRINLRLHSLNIIQNKKKSEM